MLAAKSPAPQSAMRTRRSLSSAVAAGRCPLHVVASGRPSVRVNSASGGRTGPTGSNPIGGSPVGASGTPVGPGSGTPIGSGYTGTGYTGAGGVGGGAGLGGSGGRPVGTGGSGGSGPTPPELPAGWTWTQVLLTLLGVALAVPAWRYINRRYLAKPEPEHTLAKAEDAAADIKHKGTVSKVTSAVKHATVDPIKDVVGAGVQAVKHSDTGRAAQHKAEDAKDSVDIAATDVSHKTERGVDKAKKHVKHAAENVAASVKDAESKAESKAHEASVKGSRALQRGKEKVDDAVYEAEASAGKTSKSVLENIKGAAQTVGRKLHVVADSTEKGIKKGADSTEHGLGVKTTPLPSTDSSERTKYYVAGGAVIGTGVLAAALYYWDRKGGDIAGKVKKLQDKTKEAADKALHRATGAGEPAAARPPPSV